MGMVIPAFGGGWEPDGEAPDGDGSGVVQLIKTEPVGLIQISDMAEDWR